MAASDDNRTALTHYGAYAHPPITPETKALRVATLEAWWAAGPHPSQVQRRRDERWARRGPLITVLAEHAYRPLQLRAQAIAAAAVGAPLVQLGLRETPLSSGSPRLVVASEAVWGALRRALPGSAWEVGSVAGVVAEVGSDGVLVWECCGSAARVAVPGSPGWAVPVVAWGC
jgi:hypothetical protein